MAKDTRDGAADAPITEQDVISILAGELKSVRAAHDKLPADGTFSAAQGARSTLAGAANLLEREIRELNEVVERRIKQPGAAAGE